MAQQVSLQDDGNVLEVAGFAVTCLVPALAIGGVLALWVAAVAHAWGFALVGLLALAGAGYALWTQPAKTRFDARDRRYRSWSVLGALVREGSLDEFEEIVIAPKLTGEHTKEISGWMIELVRKDGSKWSVAADTSYERAEETARLVRLVMQLPERVVWDREVGWLTSPPEGSDLFVCPVCLGRPVRDVAERTESGWMELPGGGSWVKVERHIDGYTWVCQTCQGEGLVPRAYYLERGL